MSMDFLEAVEQQLVAATERGVTRRRRWRWPWPTPRRLPWRAPTVGIAAGVAAALTASAIAATLTLPASHPRTHAAAAPRVNAVRSFTQAGAVPTGFQPESFTAISETKWWLLGTAPCGRHACTAIAHTTDGGPHFTRIAAPPTRAVYNIRFADARDGYAYEPQLWITHNGGRTWTSNRSFGANELAIAGGFVYAVAKTGVAASQLMRSPVAHNDWQLLKGAGHGQLSGLWVQGTTVIIQAGNRLLVSTDRGARFRRVRGVQHAGDCSYDAVSPASVLWAVCSTGMALDEILRSTDSGNTFTRAANVPNGPIDAFTAASSTEAVVSGQGPLYRTADGGASWTPVTAPSAGWTYLGFSDATHGAAIGNFGSGGHPNSRLYYTTDGGTSYHLVNISP